MTVDCRECLREMFGPEDFDVLLVSDVRGPSGLYICERCVRILSVIVVVDGVEEAA